MGVGGDVGVAQLAGSGVAAGAEGGELAHALDVAFELPGLSGPLTDDHGGQAGGDGGADEWAAAAGAVLGEAGLGVPGAPSEVVADVGAIVASQPVGEAEEMVMVACGLAGGASGLRPSSPAVAPVGCDPAARRAGPGVGWPGVM